MRTLTLRRHSTIALLAFALLTLARPARADTALPFVASSSESAVLLFVLIVPLEAFVLQRVLRVPFRRALLESLLANAVTTALGVGFAFASIVLPFDVLAGAAGFFLLYVVSVFVEGWVVQRRLHAEPRRVYAASAIMNTVSYALLAVVALIVLDLRAAARRQQRDAATMQAASMHSTTPLPVFVGGGMQDGAHPQQPR